MNVDKNGNLYFGDCAQGDREATEEEVEVWNRLRMAANTSISPRQIRHALNAVGLRQTVEAAIAAGSQDLKDWWEFAAQFERQHPIVVSMGAQLGQTPEQLDALFELGSTL